MSSARRDQIQLIDPPHRDVAFILVSMYLGNKRLDLDRPVDADDGLMLGVRLDSHTLAHLASLYLPQHPFHRLAWVKSMRVDLLGQLLPLAPMDPQAKVGLELPLPILHV